MTDDQPFVFIIDDDASVRTGLKDLLCSVGLRVESFGSTEEFLRSTLVDAPGCIILDVRLPGPSGLEFQRTLSTSGIRLPVVFISGHADVPMSVRAMKAGAVEFLTKPVREQELLDAVQTAIERDRGRRKQESVVAELRDRYNSMTLREREVFAIVVTGCPSKQIAAKLKLSEMTVKVHRGQVMRKMQANTLVELVRMADDLGILTTKS